MKIKVLCFGLLFLADFQLFACSEVTVVDTSKGVVVSARSLDLSIQPATNIVLNPRGLSITSPSDPAYPLLPPLQWVSRYGSVVVSGAADQNLAVVDGINEKGLSVATLWFEDATYPLPETENPVLAVSYLSRYILDNFATVAEAVSAIATLNIFGDYIVYFDNTLPAHVTLHDATGDSALIEFTSATPPPTITHPIGPYNITTNEPKYSEQILNLANYCYFNPPVFPSTVCTPLLPLPGDVDSESRFVRLAAFLKTMPSANISNKDKARAAVYSMIETVVETPGSKSSPYSTPGIKAYPTWWIAIRDNINLKYFLQPVQSETFYVDLNKINFSSPKTQHRTLNLYQKGLVDDVTMLLLLGNEF